MGQRSGCSTGEIIKYHAKFVEEYIRKNKNRMINHDFQPGEYVLVMNKSKPAKDSRDVVDCVKWWQGRHQHSGLQAELFGSRLGRGWGVLGGWRWCRLYFQCPRHAALCDFKQKDWKRHHICAHNEGCCAQFARSNQQVLQSRLCLTHFVLSYHGSLAHCLGHVRSFGCHRLGVNQQQRCKAMWRWASHYRRIACWTDLDRSG